MFKQLPKQGNKIACCALIISILSFVFSIGVFSQFRPKAEIDGFILTTDQELDFGYILSGTFFNVGDKEGIIENIYIDLSHKDWSIKLEPINEISIEKFFEFRNLSPDVYLGPFHNFNIVKRGIEQKTFLFYSTSENEHILEPGDYCINLYIKTLNKSQFQKVDSFKFNVFDNVISELKTGKKSVYFMGGHNAYTLEKD